MKIERSENRNMIKRQNPFVHAFRGILATYRSERNFKIHLGCSILVVAMGIGFPLSGAEWRWVAACIALVFSLELLNTAIEAIIDLLSPTYHPLAKKAKDAAAGAVLIGAVFSLIVAASIFLPKWGFSIF